MPKLLRFLLVILLLVSIFSRAERVQGSTVVIADTYEQSTRGTVDNFPFLLLRGDATQRGKAYGVLAAPEIISSLSVMASYMSSQGLSWNTALAAVTTYKYSSRYQTEMSAMLDGIIEALPPNGRIIPALGRAPTVNDLKVLETADVFAAMHCSQFSAWGSLTSDGEVIIGRNWDYPPIFLLSNSFILAVDPSEPDLQSTIDTLYFGLIGVGMVSINEQKVYISANSGGSANGISPTLPYPVMLLARDVLETAQPSTATNNFVETIKNKVALRLIFHISFPISLAGGNLPAVIEYAPTSSTTYSLNVRSPVNPPNAIILTNHFLSVQGSGDSQTRYQSLLSDIQQYQNSGQVIGFTQAKTMMSHVARSNTVYTGIIWPKERRIMVAISPQEGVPATSGTYIEVKWDDIFGINPPVISGDANGDGHVDVFDYNVWFNNYGTTITSPPYYAKGDFNGNTYVDVLDYMVLLNNYGM